MVNQKPQEDFCPEERGASTGRFGPCRKRFSSHPIRASPLSSTAKTSNIFSSLAEHC